MTVPATSLQPWADTFNVTIRIDHQDLAITPTGDLMVTEDGDICLSTAYPLAESEEEKLVRGIVQQVIVGLMTNSPDFYCNPSIGSNLEDFMGEFNTEQVGELMRSNIVGQMKQIDGAQLINVEVYPTSLTSVEALIIMRVETLNLTVNLDFDFSEGLVVRGLSIRRTPTG